MDVQKRNRSVTRTKRKSWVTPFISLISRFYVYFSLYQYFWTCPKDGSDDRAICRYGDQAKTFVQPYAEPYYNQYLSSYVDQATPYVKVANERYVQPAGKYAFQQYDTYGKPKYQEARTKASSEYQRLVAPKLAQATSQGQQYYNEFLADHVSTGKKLYIKYKPIIQQSILHTYATAVERGYPYYIAALPYMIQAWEKASETAGWVGVEGKGWVERRWGMHVEPQLWRIQERLGKKIVSENGATSVKDAKVTSSQTANPNASSNTKPASEPITEDIREQIEADLDSWTAKFVAAGQKAVSDVTTKLDVLCQQVLKEQSSISASMLATLNENIEKEFKTFKIGAQSLVGSSGHLESKNSELQKLVQKTGLNMKNSAQVVRKHSQTFLTDLYDKTASTVDDTLEVLDSVHDVGMQDLGMKWAWMEGVTYKDWARYHELKKSFGSIKQSVIRAGQGHKGLREVTDYAKSVEEAANKVATVAADELVVLKKIGKRKIEDNDNNDEWTETFLVSKDGTIASSDATAPVAESSETSHVEELGDIELDNHGQVVNESPQSEALDLKEDGNVDTEATKDGGSTHTDSSPVEELGDLEVDNKGQIIGEKQSDADNLKQDISGESHIEDVGGKVDNHGKPIAEPAVHKHHSNVDDVTAEEYREQDRIMQKDEL